jgi:2-methylfumaryl-CoA hydratase
MAVVFSQTVEDISENARANLEYINMRFGVPVYIGDTIEAESKVLSVKPSSRDPVLGVVHVQTTGRNQNGEVVLAYERKVQVWKSDLEAKVDDGTAPAAEVQVALGLPAYDASRKYGELAHLTSTDTYFEDFTVGDVLEHWRGRVVTDEHIALTAMLDNTSQVHCNQHLIDQNPERFLGGRLIVFGGIPFNLCLGLSCPDVADNSLGDVIYTSGRHTAPIFAGDTVFASTEISSKADYPSRPDLGLLGTILRGHKFVKKDGGFERTEIFYLERQIAVKRRSHYL